MTTKATPAPSDIATTVMATAHALTLQLFSKTVTEIKGIRVFDVGQGDCLGLRDQNDEVFGYVDYGGNEYHPDNKNPGYTATRLPVQRSSQYVPVILTHWDKDHYWSANKKNPAAQQCEWLVPRQWVSPQATRFAAKLANAKCWPDSLGKKPVSFAVGADYEIDIRKCEAFPANTGSEDRNHSGLAITITRKPPGETAMYMLLPGDCAFDRIPSLPSMLSLCAIVAYHHGASTDWSTRTEQELAKAHSSHHMAYSYGTHAYGQANHYGHPQRSNYRSCHPDWDQGARTTEEARAKGRESEDLDW